MDDLTPNGRQATGSAEDPIHVTRNGGDVPLGLLVRLVGLTFLGYVVISLLVGGYLWYRQDNARFEDQRAFASQLAAANRNLIKAHAAATAAQDKKIQAAVADLCADAELRDTVITNQSRAIAALLGQVENPTKQVLDLIEASSDAVATLEPANEEDCPLPPERP